MSSPGDGDNGAAAGGIQPCDRPSGTQPRNSIARAVEYYFGKDHICLLVAANVPGLLLRRNQYRQTVVFTALIGEGVAGVILAHSQADCSAPHPAFVMPSITGVPVAAGKTMYLPPLILTFEKHGPMVTEEWWGMPDGGFVSSSINAQGYNYSD